MKLKFDFSLEGTNAMRRSLSLLLLACLLLTACAAGAETGRKAFASSPRIFPVMILPGRRWAATKTSRC